MIVPASSPSTRGDRRSPAGHGRQRRKAVLGQEPGTIVCLKADRHGPLSSLAMKEPSQHCMCRQTRGKLPFYFRFTITGRGEAFQKNIIASSMLSIQNASSLLNLPKPALFLQGQETLKKQNFLYPLLQIKQEFTKLPL